MTLGLRLAASNCRPGRHGPRAAAQAVAEAQAAAAQEVAAAQAAAAQADASQRELAAERARMMSLR